MQHIINMFKKSQRLANIMDQDKFLSQMEESYKHKFAKKPEVIEGNMKALRMAFEEVQ